MTIDTGALGTSTDAIVSLVGTLGTKIFTILGVVMGLGIGLWFLYKAFGKAKGAVK